nr:hypothetical protein [Tanacetum cinerariifolium]GFA71958.1 hypothetical protein [Tanacetum cinerariifolium]
MMSRVLRIILVILPEDPSDALAFTMKMEIRLESISNKLMVGIRDVLLMLEILSKKFFLKLNLSDHRRDQVDHLMPTIKEGDVVEKFRARNDARMDKLEYKENNVVVALMNIPIFVETFSILTNFAVLEDMDGYRDEGMGDVIFGESFLREVGINAKRFEGMITNHNGNEDVTY